MSHDPTSMLMLRCVSNSWYTCCRLERDERAVVRYIDRAVRANTVKKAVRRFLRAWASILMPESGDPAQDPLMESVWEDVRGDSIAIHGVEKSASR